MKKLKHNIIFLLIIIWGIVCMFVIEVFVYAQEAQVIYDFIENKEDIPAFESPNNESKKTTVIPKGEKVLVISQTADGWYQILYHEEILYINGQDEKIEEAEISEEVVEEIEKNKADQEPTQEEIELLVDNIAEKDRNTETLPKILLGIVAFIVLFSGIGYFYINKKEKIEEAKKQKQAEVNHNDR